MKKFLFQYKFSRFELFMFGIFISLLWDEFWAAVGVCILTCIIQIIFEGKTNETK